MTAISRARRGAPVRHVCPGSVERSVSWALSYYKAAVTVLGRQRRPSAPTGAVQVGRAMHATESSTSQNPGPRKRWGRHPPKAVCAKTLHARPSTGGVGKGSDGTGCRPRDWASHAAGAVPSTGLVHHKGRPGCTLRGPEATLLLALALPPRPCTTECWARLHCTAARGRTTTQPDGGVTRTVCT